MSEENIDPSTPNSSDLSDPPTPPHNAPENAPEDGAAEAPVAARPSAGEQLRAVREAKGMSSAEVARSLKLSTRQVEALEAGDWAGLPGQTFIRGFIRNYARLLHLDPDVLVRDLDPRLMPDFPRLDVSSSISAALPRTSGPQRRDLVVVFTGLLLVVLAVLAFFFTPPDFWQSQFAEWSAGAAHSDTPAAESAQTTESAEPSVPNAEPAPGAPAPEPAAPAAPAAMSAPAPAGTPVPVSTRSAGAGLTQVASPGAASTPQAAAQPLTRPSTNPAPVPSAPQAVQAPLQAVAASAAASAASSAPADRAGGVQLAFTQPSWVEIRDRSGQIIFSQLNPAGSQRYVEGVPPFVLVIGNATHVSVKYKGKSVELSQRSKDDVARLTLE